MQWKMTPLPPIRYRWTLPVILAEGAQVSHDVQSPTLRRLAPHLPTKGKCVNASREILKLNLQHTRRFVP